MMTYDPAELSALLDGELDATRAAELRAAMREDDQLRTEFERLAGLHQRLLDDARSRQFQPQIALADSTASLRWPVLALVACVLAVRLASKLAPPEVGAALEGLLLLVLLSWLATRLWRATDADYLKLVQQAVAG